MNKIIRIFSNVNLNAGHNGLSNVASKFKLSTNNLSNGEYLIFINRKRNRVKLYTSNNVIAYLKLPNNEVIDLRVISHIPECFNGKTIDYNKALSKALDDIFIRKSKEIIAI